MSLIFITHDLGIIAEIADQVAVSVPGQHCRNRLSFGRFFSNPQHPYTKGLLACRPKPDQRLQLLPTVADYMEVEDGNGAGPIIREKDHGRGHPGPVSSPGY